MDLFIHTKEGLKSFFKYMSASCLKVCFQSPHLFWRLLFHIRLQIKQVLKESIVKTSLKNELRYI